MRSDLANHAKPDARKYYEAMSSGDIPTATGLFAADIKWHQPGGHRFAGLKDGAVAVGEMIGAQMALTGGTFGLKFTGNWRSRRVSVCGLMPGNAARSSVKRLGPLRSSRTMSVAQGPSSRVRNRATPHSVRPPAGRRPADP
ncbi:nuclear transport factor 2 family protein [Glycomyces luteolus]|uniref:Nuclear transport factor 2 family protein n=1 Tax=Glycomyces luteolus TaxID=2670330 RepID=A0A9X3PE19_9ACTN|nr:nuclear transport factor 2 family protein [Glycomyces luteolus]MDA1362311.1 nuclear transport factor 2 family protein [Glycomyces luteolus]